MNKFLQMPKWQKELESFKGIKTTFIIEGNVYDKYPFYNKETEKYTFSNLDKIIEKIFDDGGTKDCYDFLNYDPFMGFGVKSKNESNKMAEKLNKGRNTLSIFKQEGSALNGLFEEPADKLIRDSEIIRTTISSSDNSDVNKKSIAIVVDFASRFLSTPDNLAPNEIQFFLNLQYASSNSKLGDGKNRNTLILIVDKFNDIPTWFYMNNPNVRQISIPNPDREIRKLAIDKSYTYFEDKQEAEKEKYVDLTDGMKVVEIEALEKLLRKEQDNIKDITELVSIYKYGFKENKWLQIREKLENIDIEEKIYDRVKGQNEAVKSAVNIIKRSVVGLSGLQHSSNTKPKGIMFLVGPTGTGKTELVKTITELLFEDERSLIRFDMSEYSEENSDQKLFGAPPGYVGYGQGGQLTNAVRNNPFSVLLFDEIEKAHPTIMDKFLQILEDGRMTDGEGNTVYFNETIIFFTSNKGISEEEKDYSGKITKRVSLVDLNDSYDTIVDKVINSVKTYFKPEIIGRIGEGNIVVFNFISESVSKEIATSLINKIVNNIQTEQKITIRNSSEVVEFIVNKCKEEKYRQSGGRGIGNAVEELYLNPLSAYIFDSRSKENSIIDINLCDGCISFKNA